MPHPINIFEYMILLTASEEDVIKLIPLTNEYPAGSLLVKNWGKLGEMSRRTANKVHFGRTMSTYGIRRTEDYLWHPTIHPSLWQNCLLSSYMKAKQQGLPIDDTDKVKTDTNVGICSGPCEQPNKRQRITLDGIQPGGTKLGGTPENNDFSAETLDNIFAEFEKKYIGVSKDLFDLL